jgi:hypothetical protein
MSKPDASGAKSLEEILASIRKSLGGEGSDAASGARGAGPRPAPAMSDPEPRGDDDGLLSARLAGALNGPTNGAAVDTCPNPDFTAPVDCATATFEAVYAMMIDETPVTVCKRFLSCFSARVVSSKRE